MCVVASNTLDTKLDESTLPSRKCDKAMMPTKAISHSIECEVVCVCDIDTKHILPLSLTLSRYFSSFSLSIITGKYVMAKKKERKSIRGKNIILMNRKITDREKEREAKKRVQTAAVGVVLYLYSSTLPPSS